ncbi:hypothetical protein IM543_09080 [Massilia sp. UMI-21]|nr:hypothetical protein IM543_09080 [Massilia sp. UMI-21]
MNNAHTSPASSGATAPVSDDAAGSRASVRASVGAFVRCQIHTDPHARALPATAGFSEQPANDTVRPVGRVGIMGANGMGIGLARALLDADMPVTVFDRREALDQGRALLRASYTDALTGGALTANQRYRRLALFAATERFHHLKDCDLIIEVMSIDAKTRETFFRWLDETGKPGAVLVANASGSQLDGIARLTRRPGDVLGLRFPDTGLPSKAACLVRARETSGDAYTTTAELLTGICKLQA